MGSEDKNRNDKTRNVDDRAKVFIPESNDDRIRGRRNRDYKFLEEINADLADQKHEDVTMDEQQEVQQHEDAVPEVSMTKNKKQNKKFPRWAKILLSILGTLACIVLVMVGTPWGRAKTKKLVIYLATEYAYSKMEYDDGSTTEVQEPEQNIEVEEKKEPLSIMWGNSGHRESGRHEDYTVNILLLGEEAIGSGTARGRTDMMMIATMNLKTKTVKLTSLMRDMLLHIPEYEGKTYLDNKLNSAYEIGGIQLVYETIAENFDIALDGYALVGFENFENIINAIGGVEVTLSETEANYLNRTNYISKKKYRNVVPGKQTLNGNQALGFCRVRHVPTVDDQHYDYGRTSRQRVVLNAIFNKCKSLSLPQMIVTMNELLQYVTTDITKEQFRNYLEIGLSLDIKDIANCRIPAEHTFEEGSARGMSVLIPDLDKNIKVLHSFIFGDVLEEGLNDGTILDGEDHLNAIEEKKKQEEENNSASNTYNSNSSNSSGQNSSTSYSSGYR